MADGRQFEKKIEKPPYLSNGLADQQEDYFNVPKILRGGQELGVKN